MKLVTAAYTRSSTAARASLIADGACGPKIDAGAASRAARGGTGACAGRDRRRRRRPRRSLRRATPPPAATPPARRSGGCSRRAWRRRRLAAEAAARRHHRRPPPAVMPAPVTPIVSMIAPIARSARRPQGRPLGRGPGRVEHEADLDDAAGSEGARRRRTRISRSPASTRFRATTTASRSMTSRIP